MGDRSRDGQTLIDGMWEEPGGVPRGALPPCPSIPVTINPDAVLRFHPGADRNMSDTASTRDRGIGCLAIIAVVILFMVFASKPEAPSTHPAIEAPPEKPCLTLVKHKATRSESGMGRVWGTVQNSCDKSYRYVEIDFKLTDAEGAVVGTAMTNITALGPYEAWKFEAIAMEDFAHYELVGINGD